MTVPPEPPVSGGSDITTQQEGNQPPRVTNQPEPPAQSTDERADADARGPGVPDGTDAGTPAVRQRGTAVPAPAVPPGVSTDERVQRIAQVRECLITMQNMLLGLADFAALVADLEQVARERDDERTGRHMAEDERGQAEQREARLLEAVNLALMHLEDRRAIAAVRAALADEETA